MGASVATGDLITAMRVWAEDPSGLCFVLRGFSGSVAIFKDDIESRNDGELIAFIQARCSE